MRGKFVFNDDCVYKMPVHFGGDPFYPVRTVYGDMTCIAVSFETEADAVLRLVPEDFELLLSSGDLPVNDGVTYLPPDTSLWARRVEVDMARKPFGPD